MPHPYICSFDSASAWGIPAWLCSQTHLHWMLRGETVEFWRFVNIEMCLAPVRGLRVSWQLICAMIFSLQMVSGRRACGAMSVHWGWNTEDWNLHNHWPLVAAEKACKWCHVDFQSQISAYAALCKTVGTDVCRKFPLKLNLKFLLLEWIDVKMHRGILLIWGNEETQNFRLVCPNVDGIFIIQTLPPKPPSE